MEIKKIIKLPITAIDDKIICDDLTTLSWVLGTKSVSGNLHVYKVTKKGNQYVIPKETIKERIIQLEARIKKTKEYLEVMKQVVR